MGLINDDTTPFNLTKLRTVWQNHLKSGDQGIKLVCTWDEATLNMKAVKSEKAWNVLKWGAFLNYIVSFLYSGKPSRKYELHHYPPPLLFFLLINSATSLNVKIHCLLNILSFLGKWQISLNKARHFFTLLNALLMYLSPRFFVD